jgi:hypothetical protein
MLPVEPGTHHVKGAGEITLIEPDGVSTGHANVETAASMLLVRRTWYRPYAGTSTGAQQVAPVRGPNV